MRLTSLLLAVLTVVTFISCGSDAPAEDQTAVTAPADTPAPAPAPNRDGSRTEDQPVQEPPQPSIPEENPASPSPAAPPSPAPAAAPETLVKQSGSGTAPTASPVSEPVLTSPTEVIKDTPEADKPPREMVAKTPDHKPWDDILQQYVDKKGLVDYAALKKNEAELDAYLATLAITPPGDLWSHNEGLAYWINAYNAYTFKLILNNYPVAKITDLDGGDPWKVKWIKLGGKTYSLNNIEHDIIRPRFGDSRIHFAVVCAAKSCPPLLNKAFDPAILNLQLDVVTRRFINNSNFNQVTDEVRISKIFDWYQEDFGEVKDYMNQYLGQKISPDQEIGYLEYDWSLNKQ